MNTRSFYALAGLYILSLLCGLILLARQPAESKYSLRRLAGNVFAKNTVAVLDIYGPIYISESPSGFGFAKDADYIVRKLHRLNEQKDVKAVVLRINSPGGTVAAVQEIVTEVHRMQKNGKIVVASMGDVAASGGYYIASQSNRIVCDPGTLTGSIGVIMEVANVQGLLTKFGVNVRAIRSGRLKDIGSPFRQMTPEEQALLQGLINSSYEQFVTAVSTGRKMDRARLLPLADGRIFTGVQAKEVGLIDELGNSEQAIETAARLAGISSPRVVYDTNESLSQFFRFFSESSRINILPDAVNGRKIRLSYMME